MAAFSADDDCWMMEPRELADFKEIFNEACRRTMTARDTEAAQMLAKRLVEAAQSGVRDRDTLLRLAGTKILA
jgi:hypothetical protein